MLLNNKQNQKGFSLIELLVSIFILSVGIVGIFSLITFNFSNTREIKNNLIAAGLVQEGMEVVRNIRDNDWHQENPFGTSLSEGTYRVQWDSDALIPIEDNPPLGLTIDGKYIYNAGVPTLFHREIIIVSALDSPEIIATSKVSWEGRAGTNTISAETHLYDWF